MVGPNAERRLAAVLALDIVGFSAMMNQDELGTLRRVQAFQREIVAPIVQSNRGRVFKLIGDGALADFQSVHDAFAAALAILEDLAASDLDLRVRIGLHIGDLIFEDGDVFGDGVNIAARLEGIARPGSVAVSERAYSELGKTHANFEDLGKITLKNIKEPIRVFLYSHSISSYAFKFPWPSRRRVVYVLMAVGLAIFAVGGFSTWQSYYNSPERIVREDLLNYPCSWLGIRSSGSVNGVPLIEVEGGVFGEKDSLRRKLLGDLARLWKKPVNVSVEGVGTLPASLCDFAERFRSIRYDGPRRFILGNITQGSVQNDKYLGGDGPLPNVITVRVYTDALRPNATLFALEETGEINKLVSVNQFISDLVYKEREGAKEFEIMTDHRGASAVLLIDSNRPIPDEVVSDGRLEVRSIARLEQAAKAGDWNVEMIWFDLSDGKPPV